MESEKLLNRQIIFWKRGLKVHIGAFLTVGK